MKTYCVKFFRWTGGEEIINLLPLQSTCMNTYQTSTERKACGESGSDFHCSPYVLRTTSVFPRLFPRIPLTELSFNWHCVAGLVLGVRIRTSRRLSYPADGRDTTVRAIPLSNPRVIQLHTALSELSGRFQFVLNGTLVHSLRQTSRVCFKLLSW